MQKNIEGVQLVIKLVLVVAVLFAAPSWDVKVSAQQPTVSIPTVTGTPMGITATVRSEEPQVNVRSGPNVEYAKIGVLVAGEQVIVLGRTPGGEWLKIIYPGVASGVAWVYAAYVIVSIGQEVPIVEPPRDPTPLVTPTIDPILAAQFAVEIPATRLPPFTPPPPLVIPSYSNSSAVVGTNSLPWGLAISLLTAVGVFGSLISFLRGRG